MNFSLIRITERDFGMLILEEVFLKVLNLVIVEDDRDDLLSEF